jgi:hypothetical protein
VYCFVIGFSREKGEPNINPYLVEASTIFIENRIESLCHMPKIIKSNQPTDGGYLIIEKKDYAEFIKRESNFQKYIKICGVEEFINDLERYCLRLVDAELSEIQDMLLVMEQIKEKKIFRLRSRKNATRKSIKTPRFSGNKPTEHRLFGYFIHIFRETELRPDWIYG